MLPIYVPSMLFMQMPEVSRIWQSTMSLCGHRERSHPMKHPETSKFNKYC